MVTDIMLVSRAVPPVQVLSFSRSQVKSMGLPSASCTAPSSVTSTVSTTTVQEAETVGSRLEVAVMTVSPFSTALTLPSASTVAMLGSAEVQVTERSVAVQGCTLAVSLAEPPRRIRREPADNCMPETSVVGSVQPPPEVFSGMIKQVSSSYRSL